jgi:hypothetical protein
MNDKLSRRLSDDQLVLGSLELQLRNLLGVRRNAIPIVERLQGKRELAEPTTEVLGLLLSCDVDSLIAAVAALRAALEAETR